EPILVTRRPDVLLVYGDVNSTVAAALVAAKLGITIGHVEAGVRSSDWSMPAEINRVVTDRLAGFLFAPSPHATPNLPPEGIAEERVHFVGNIMIETLIDSLPAARARNAPAQYGVHERRFLLVTLHRPSNVDVPDRLRELMAALGELSLELPVLFPAHPRTLSRLEATTEKSGASVRLLGPIPYLDMLGLVSSAAIVVTDSGGLQEETSYLGVPCITVRQNTERPITCTEGTNQLVPSAARMLAAAREVLATQRRPGPRQIERWDGDVSERIVRVLCDGARYD